jgi:hypothetical protein
MSMTNIDIAPLFSKDKELGRVGELTRPEGQTEGKTEGLTDGQTEGQTESRTEGQTGTGN